MKLKKILLLLFSIIVAFIIMMYVGLWMYVYSHTRKIPVSELQSNITITLTDEQAKIIWFTVTGDKNYRENNL